MEVGWLTKGADARVPIKSMPWRRLTRNVKNYVTTWPTVQPRNSFSKLRRELEGVDALSEIRLALRGRQTVKQASKTAITRGKAISPCSSMNALRRDCVPTGGSRY